MFTHSGLAIHVCCLNKFIFFHEVQNVKGTKLQLQLQNCKIATSAVLGWGVPAAMPNASTLILMYKEWVAEDAFRICSPRLTALKPWKPWHLQLKPRLLRLLGSLAQSRHSKPTNLTHHRAWCSENVIATTFGVNLKSSHCSWAVPTQWVSC